MRLDRYVLYLCFAVALVLMQCQKEEEEPFVDLTLDESVLAVGAEAGTVRVEVSAVGAVWTISPMEDEDMGWITALKVDADILSLSYEANAAAQRTATITIEAGTQTATLQLMQDAVSLRLEKTDLAVDAAAATTQIGLSAVGAAWSAAAMEEASWITDLQKNATQDSLIISYAAHTGAVARSADIHISAGIATARFVLTQQVIPIQIDQQQLQVGAVADSREISVVAPQSWTTSTDASWVKASKADVNTLRVDCEANTGRERTATVTLAAGTQTATLRVVQQRAALSIDPTELSLSHSAGSVRVRILNQDDPNWSADANKSWITSTSQEDAATLRIDYAENPVDIIRTTTVYIVSGSRTAELTLTQAAHPAPGPLRISVSPVNPVPLSPQGGEIKVRLDLAGTGAGDLMFTNPPYDDDWCRYTRYDDLQFSFRYAPNASTEARTSTKDISLSKVVAVNGSMADVITIDFHQSGRTIAPKPSDMPEALYDLLGGDELLVLRPKIFIARHRQDPSKTSKEGIRQAITGYTMESVNPMLLRFGAYIDAAKTQIYYVRLPVTHPAEAEYPYAEIFLDSPYPVLDEEGTQLRTKDGRRDSTVTWHDDYVIYVVNRIRGNSAVRGFASINQNTLWLSDRADIFTMAHEIGHTFALKHTNNSSETCAPSQDIHNLMYSARLDEQLQYPNVAMCENRIVTSRGPMGRSEGASAKNFGMFLNVKNLGSTATYAEFLSGWEIITDPELAFQYASSYPNLQGERVLPPDALRRRVGPATFCGTHASSPQISRGRTVRRRLLPVHKE